MSPDTQLPRPPLAEARALADPPLVVARRERCKARLAALGERVAALPSLADRDELCIYVTGSYGRLEASPFSDLDLFLLHTGDETPSELDGLLVKADLIRVCREEGFPEFTDDGRYLQIHRAADLGEHLGGPEDVSRNLFTARLLLLLESRPLWGEAGYRRALREVIDVYTRDYHSHEANFRPVFLANDIVRYWKTLCLSYEHKRRRRDPSRKAKGHLVNLKLKFSRMLTCVSMLLALARTHPLSPSQLLEACTTPPLERLAIACRGVSAAEPHAARMLADYAWFLEATGRPEAEVLAWIAQRPRRHAAFERARGFGSDMYEALRAIAASQPTDLLRYLVI